MCTPTILIGAAIGGAIGYSQGGAKGALLGAGFGALGGYAFGATTGIGTQSLLGSGTGIFGTGVVGTTPSGIAMANAAGFAGGDFTAIQTASQIAAGGGGAFGTGSFGSFITSPGFSLGSQVIGFGVNMAGQAQQRAFQQAMIANQQADLSRRMVAADQDIVANNARLEVQLGIIGGQIAQGRGAIRAEQAGRGVLVDVGSAADRTAQFAADGAFKLALTRHDVKNQNRQTRLMAQGLQSESANLGFQREQLRSSFGATIGSGLQLAGSIGKSYRFQNGQLAFRT